MCVRVEKNAQLCAFEFWFDILLSGAKKITLEEAIATTRHLACPCSMCLQPQRIYISMAFTYLWHSGTHVPSAAQVGCKALLLARM